MDTDSLRSHEDIPSLLPALEVDPGDPEVARARSAIEARLLGVAPVAARIGRFVVLERIGAGGMGIVYAAFDPKLDRKVAIKLWLRRGGSPGEHERLVREAKAMAKLAHPNVVHVYEVGEHEGQVFVAMEYVRGQTLRRWWTETFPTPRETLAMCLQAGRGLAAAHAAGIVHRDFKPDNVIVGDDGRARVLDFGLARAFDEPTDRETSTAAPGETDDFTTRTGTRMGTPGYIAPEQLRGAPADPLTDQFAFCVTVWEALVGSLPFRGSTTSEVLDAVAEGRIDPAPRGKMPAWIERALRRGLSDIGGEGRWPTLDGLLQALDRDPATRRRRVVAAAAVTGGIAAAFAIGSATGTEQVPVAPCEAAEEAIASAWPDDERSAALDRVREIGGDYGAAIAPRLAARIDEFTQSWISGHREACLAHQGGEQSADLLDRRMTCLARDRSALEALAGITREATADTLPRLVNAFGALPSPSSCADVVALTLVDEPPPPESRALEEHLAQIRIQFSAGLFETADEASLEVIAEARALGYAPFLADALYVRGMILIDLDRYDEAATVMHEALVLALGAGHLDLAVRAWSQGAWTVTVRGAEPERGTFDGEALITALAERNPDSSNTMSFYSNLGSMELARGHSELARAAYERAHAIGQRLPDPDPRLQAVVLGGLALTTRDPGERARWSARAVELWTEAAGREHPRTITTRMLHAGAIEDVEAVAEACRDFHTYHPRGHGDIAMCERELAIFAELKGDRELAIAATKRWASAAIDEVELAKAKDALWDGRADEAASLLRPVVERYDAERTEATPPFVEVEAGEAEMVLGLSLRSLGDPRADALLARALDRLRRAAARHAVPFSARRLELARRAVEKSTPTH